MCFSVRQNSNVSEKVLNLASDAKWLRWHRGQSIYPFWELKKERWRKSDNYFSVLGGNEGDPFSLLIHWEPSIIRMNQPFANVYCVHSSINAQKNLKGEFTSPGCGRYVCHFFYYSWFHAAPLPFVRRYEWRWKMKSRCLFLSLCCYSSHSKKEKLKFPEIFVMPDFNATLFHLMNSDNLNSGFYTLLFNWDDNKIYPSWSYCFFLKYNVKQCESCELLGNREDTMIYYDAENK